MKDEGGIKNKEGGKTKETVQNIAPPFILGKKLGPRWGLWVLGDSEGVGGKGIIKIPG